MKSFKYWHFQQVEDTFGIQERRDLQKLSDWMQVDISDIPEAKYQAIEALRAKLLRKVNYYNEADLMHYFITPFLLLAELDNEEYRGFRERSLSVQKDDEVANGIIDFMLAKGKAIPKAPYFFIQEFKPETGTANDPIGQLLMGMLAAQQANAAIGQEKITGYGAYIIGRNWHFVVLDGKEYAVSDAYTATQKDIFTIFQMIQKVKRYAEAVVMV